jgi:hypothetical protein
MKPLFLQKAQMITVLFDKFSSELQQFFPVAANAPLFKLFSGNFKTP